MLKGASVVARSRKEPGLQRKPIAALVIGAIGVVYGDIGTSPLYTLRTCFTGPHGLPLRTENVLGVLSVIFWAIMIMARSNT